jgi:hypothetical protein
MNTHKDLPQILRKRNSAGKYDELIMNAEAFHYHDFKTDNAAPKMTLVQDLQAFPELTDIAQMVMNGQFDESLFDEPEEQPEDKKSTGLFGEDNWIKKL